VDELRILVVHLVEKTLPVVPVVNAGEVGCASRSKSSVMEAQAPVSDLGSSLRSRWPSPDCSLEALRSLAMDFSGEGQGGGRLGHILWAGLKGQCVERH
jgi:hypothetical protein